MPEIITNFKYNSPNPNFERDQIMKYSELKEKTITDYDDGHIVFCVEKRKHYYFDAKSEIDAVTGYFRELKVGVTPTSTTETTRTIFVFCSVADQEDKNMTPEAPRDPYNFVWDTKNNRIIPPTYPEDYTGVKWVLGDEDSLEDPVWMCTGEFDKWEPSEPNWQKPFLASGRDGEGIHYVYTRTKEYDLLNRPEPPTDPEDLGVWHEDPEGVTNEWRYEWVSYRRYLDRKWTPFSEATLWSSYGVWGKDGETIEYVFMQTGYNEAPPTPSFKSGTTEADKQKDEVVGHLNSWNGHTWRDDPPGINSNFPVIWCSTRKRTWKPDINRIEGGYNYWGLFSTPTVWARWGKDGAAGKDGKDGKDGAAGVAGAAGVDRKSVV